MRQQPGRRLSVVEALAPVEQDEHNAEVPWSAGPQANPAPAGSADHGRLTRSTSIRAIVRFIALIMLPWFEMDGAFPPNYPASGILLLDVSARQP
jgi:hypothetical protein